MFGNKRKVKLLEKMLMDWAEYHDEVRGLLGKCLVVASPDDYPVVSTELQHMAGGVVTPSKLRKMHISGTLAKLHQESR